MRDILKAAIFILVSIVCVTLAAQHINRIGVSTEPLKRGIEY